MLQGTHSGGLGRRLRPLGHAHRAHTGRAAVEGTRSTDGPCDTIGGGGWRGGGGPSPRCCLVLNNNGPRQGKGEGDEEAQRVPASGRQRFAPLRRSPTPGAGLVS